MGPVKGSDLETMKLLRGGRTLRDGGEEGRALLFSHRVLAWIPEEAADGIDAEVIPRDGADARARGGGRGRATGDERFPSRCRPAGAAPGGTLDRTGHEGGLPVQSDGRIAGSSLTMNGAVRNFWRATGRPLAEVVDMASRNPARLLGLKRKGSLEPGCDADIVCLDVELEVVMTFVGGRRVV